MTSSSRGRIALSLLILSGITVAACGTPTPPGGMGKLGDKTFAGQNKCNPKSHDRPFIIEWDATDQSSFQSYAASDVVVVKYEGCEMKVLDGCREDNAKGKNGVYNPVQWTSGGVETIDIHDQGELYSKLPLGAATLSGKVESGEKLHMEYYVSGTRTSTRDSLYRAELDKNPRCAGATHFVYAYNLGAFAIATQSNLKGEINGSYLGFGAGGSKSNETKTEKKGGELSSCKGNEAREIEGCKVPVRLTLREISPGDNPAKAALSGKESDKALNATGLLKAETDAQKKALALYESARQKSESGDGKGCLADLDQHDQLDPRPGGLSTNGASIDAAMTRGHCLALAGQCSGAARDLLRKAWEARTPEAPAERIDGVVSAELGKYCRVGNGSGVDDKSKFAVAKTTLLNGGNGITRTTVTECQTAFDDWMKLHAKVDPTAKYDSVTYNATMCFVKAGDCAAAWKTYKAINDAKGPGDGWKGKDDKQTRVGFEGIAGECKGK